MTIVKGTIIRFLPLCIRYLLLTRQNCLGTKSTQRMIIINDSPSSQKSSWESNKKTIGDHLFKQVFVSSDGPRVPSFLSDTKNILACLPVCKKSTAFRRCWSMIKWWSRALLYTTTCTDADGDVAGDEEAGAFLTLSRVTFPNHLLLLVLVHSGFYLPGLSSGW